MPLANTNTLVPPHMHGVCGLHHAVEYMLPMSGSSCGWTDISGVPVPLSQVSA